MKVVAAVTAVLLAALPAMAQREEPLTPEDFLKRAMQDNIADVEIGRLVQSDPSLPADVQAVGREISRRSLDLSGELTKLSAELKIPVGNQISEQDRQMIQRLSRMQGAEFVREYLQYVVNDLEHDATLYEKGAQSDNPSVRRVASQALPAVKADVARAREVYDQQVANKPE
ncbi:MAG: DUF4142 domain-containing protein [Solirubrobacterales bacterium]